jgi:hypothetical protein
MAIDTNKDRPKQTMKVLALGLPRSGSLSMTAALEILGYPEVYHLHKIPYTSRDYDFWLRANEAKKRNAFSRSDWDEVLGKWEGVADIGAAFAPQLAEAYPEAKVIILQRPYNKWAASWRLLMSLFDSTTAKFCLYVTDPLLASRRTSCIRQLAMTSVGASEFEDTMDDDRIRAGYERHYEELRRVVPRERLLEMDLGAGWEPLCNFLGKPIPDEPFPKVNSSEELKEGIEYMQSQTIWVALTRIVLPWVVGTGAVVVGLWMARSKQV